MLDFHLRSKMMMAAPAWILEPFQVMQNSPEYFLECQLLATCLPPCFHVWSQVHVLAWARSGLEKVPEARGSPPAFLSDFQGRKEAEFGFSFQII